jgi:hypothetical protein
MKFKVGDRVQLRGVLSFDKAGRVIQPRENGVVIEVTDEGYTVEFDDSMTPISGITDDEIEPAKE